MADGSSPCPMAAFLQPADLVIGRAPMSVKTIVGSCVAIMMRAPRLGLAAIAHCLLPEAGVPARSIPREVALRYVDTTIEIMVRKLAEHGADLQDLEVKLFGGADSLNLSSYSVGKRNVEAAHMILGRYGLRAQAVGVGGKRGRAIEFHTGTGDVFVRTLPAERASTERL